MGRPPHAPTPETRRTVEQHAAVGTRHDQIAKILGISRNTMKKFYREELDLGLARADAVIASTLFAQARGGNTTAMIFWLKTRGGWREASRIEHAGAPGEPIEVRPLDATRLSDDALAELMAARRDAPERG
jgi:hypothetical protein